MYLKKYFDTSASDSDTRLDSIQVVKSHIARRVFVYHVCLLFSVVTLGAFGIGSLMFVQHIPLNRTRVPCAAELANVKHQLEAEIEYKNRIDQLLTNAQRYHEADKDRFKSLMQSCFALTQQNLFWKYQLDDVLQDIGATQESQ